LLSTAVLAIVSLVAVQDQPLNRRERKTQRTRHEIVRAAAELVLEEGYARATIARIAERADLATRTVTTRFASKEDIFFEEIDKAVERAEQHLSAPDGDTIDRLRAWIEELAARAPQDRDVRRLRTRAVAHDPELRALRVEHFNRAHTAIARSVAADTGQPAEAVGPQMMAAAAVAMLGVVEQHAAEQPSQGRNQLEGGFRILRGALDTLAA
jgi:AcrR family transcriptional regulator